MISLTKFYHKTQDYIFGRKNSTDTTETKTQDETSTSSRKSVYNSILSNPLESYFRTAVKLLIWEQPYLSAFAFVTLNIFYWLIVSWNRRFISILSIFSIFLFLYRNFNFDNYSWPKITVPPSEKEAPKSCISNPPGYCSIPEVNRIANDVLGKMKVLFKDVWKLRKENRGLFCSLMCGFFSFLAFVGKIFPGVLIVYGIVLFMTLGPGIMLHLIPETLFEQFNGFFNESDGQASPTTPAASDSDLEEFVPELSPENLRQLSLKDDVLELPSLGKELAEQEDSLPDFGEESYVNESDDFSLYQGLGSFPSVEEENESDLDEDSDNLVPKVSSAPEKTEMRFDPTHFKEDSSSSESDPFTDGLSFNQKEEAKKTTEEVKKSTTDSQVLSLSDEEDLADFEILEDTDIPT